MAGKAEVRSYRMTDEDFEQVKAAGALQGKSPSLFVRESALMRARRAETDGSDEKVAPLMTAEQELLARGLMTNLRGVRGLLNQIAKKLNIYAASGAGSPPAYEDCEAAINATNETVRELKDAVAAWGGKL